MLINLVLMKNSLKFTIDKRNIILHSINMAKKSAARRAEKPLLEKHPNLMWLLLIFILAYVLVVILGR
jgi:hypothetical protein